MFSLLLPPALRSVNWGLHLRDLLVVIVWFGILSILFRLFAWPLWLYYLLVFGGVAVYTFAETLWRLRRERVGPS